MSRLIDADALRKRIKAKNASNAMMKAMREECVAEIDDAPTIEPKMGKWISKADQRWHCSLCDGIAPKGYRWNYCPNCGARMEGGEAE